MRILLLLLMLTAICLAGASSQYVAAEDQGNWIYRGTPDEHEVGRWKCIEHLWSVHFGREIPQPKIIREEIETFQIIAEKSLVYREESVKLATRLKLQIKEKTSLSGNDLNLLKLQLAYYLQLREQLYCVFR